MRKCVGLLSAVALVSTSAAVVLAEDVKTAEELPEAVRNTLVKEAQGATIEDVERETRNGATVYEVELERNNEEWDLTIDEKGKVISRRREVETRETMPQAKPKTQSPSQPQPQPQPQPPSK